MWLPYNEAMATFLIYGANGYTGSLIAHEAVAHGMRPILAGRNAEAVGQLVGKLGLEHRVFSLEDPATVAGGMQGVLAVLHCAGAFAHTSKVMVSRLECPEGYTMTARAAVAIMERVLGGQVQPGFQTPSMVYGPDFVLGLEATRREVFHTSPWRRRCQTGRDKSPGRSIAPRHAPWHDEWAEECSLFFAQCVS